MAIQKGQDGSIYAHYGSSIAATGEACEQDSGNTYKITDIAKRYWDKDVAPTVYENGVASTKDYTIEYPGGRIVFPSAPTTPVTVDCNYFKVARVAGCREYTLDNGYETIDVTEFNDAYRMRESIIHDFSARLEKIKMDAMFSDPSDINDAFLFVFYENLDIDTLIDPYVDGNFEIDDDSDGVGNGWSAHSSGSPTGSRSLISGGFAGDKFQRINLTATSAPSEYGIRYLLSTSTLNDHVAIEFRYKTSGVAGLDIRARIGVTGTVETFAASADWTRAVATRKFDAAEAMNIYIHLYDSTGTFSGDAKLDVDFVRAIHLPTGNAQNRLEGYGRIANSLSVPVGDIGAESLSVEGDGGLYRRTDEVQL